MSAAAKHTRNSVPLCNKNAVAQSDTEEIQRFTEKNLFGHILSIVRKTFFTEIYFSRIRSYILLSFFFILMSSLPVSAQSSGSITGKIVDSKTGEGLPSVNVLVKGTYYGASSDIDGKFIIGKVNPGVYNISITLLGYKAVEYTGIKVETGKPVELNVKLEESALTLGKEVVIKIGRAHV